MIFNLKSILLPPAFESGGLYKKIITAVPIRDPQPNVFFRIRQNLPEWESIALLLALDEGEEEYSESDDPFVGTPENTMEEI